jgi:hypothetical protein
MVNRISIATRMLPGVEVTSGSLLRKESSP